MGGLMNELFWIAVFIIFCMFIGMLISGFVDVPRIFDKYKNGKESKSHEKRSKKH
jgi:hypothetical protein